MPIRPIDIRRKEFKSGFRGYDANQVDDFLDQVADEFERAHTENQRMREEISGLRDRLEQFDHLEGSIRDALVHAERAAKDLRESARLEADNVRSTAQREADLTIQEAQTRSHQMLADSSSRVERVQASYEALEKAKREFQNDFRHLLRTHLDLIEKIDAVSARQIEASLRESLDTESIAVAREAAANDPDATQVIEQQGPLASGSDEEPAEEPGRDPYDDPGATQAFSPEEHGDFGDETQAAPTESEEPEYDPSSVEREPETQASTQGYEPQTGAEQDRGQVAPDDEQDRRADEFFDRGREEEEGNRIFRASRFLRRRDQ